MGIDKRKGKYVKCAWCKTKIYRMLSRIRKYNFCDQKHRILFAGSPLNTDMSKGWHHQKETIEIIRQASLDRDYNAVLTDESRQKMAVTAKNRVWTDEQREAARQRKLGKKNTREQNRKIKKHAIYGEENNMWKGDFASYYAMHAWVIRHKGKAKKCVDKATATLPCKGRFEWSNVDHKYRRNLNDYTERCTLHHRIYDIQHGLAHPKGKAKRFFAKAGNIQKRKLK